MLSYGGAYQITLSTVIPDFGIELHSSYLGHPDASQTAAAHLLLAPGRTPAQWTVAHRPEELPVRDERRRCLLDHLATLAERLEQLTDDRVRVEIDDRALALLDEA